MTARQLTDDEKRNLDPGELSEKAKEARRAYQREYRRKNPEILKAQKNRYWEKKAREMELAKQAEKADN